MEVFQIEYKGLEGRLDPFFYRPQFHTIKKRLDSSRFPIQSILELSLLVTDGIHKTPRYSENGLPFIQVNNIKEGLVNFEHNLKYVTEDWEDIVLKRYSPRPGDILITKDGTIGIAAMVPDDFVSFSIFVSVAAIRPNSKMVIPQFLEIMINSPIVQRQIYRQTRGAVLVHLLLEEIRKLLIPVPFLEMQERIVSLMAEAYSRRKKNEEEAEGLYNSIDDCLSTELGVNKVAFRVKKNFTIDSRRLLANRVDPFYHQQIFEENLQSIINGKYTASPLSDVANLITSGQRPKGGVRNISEGIPSLGGEHINALGIVAQTKLKYIPEEFHKSHLDSRVLPNDILLVKDGATTGKVGFVPEDYPFKEVNINEHLFLIRIKDGYDPFYVFCFLKSATSQIQIRREITGATITGLVRDAVNKLLIPIPPKRIQEQISAQIEQRIGKAKDLKVEGKDYLKKAKMEMEAILFEQAQ